MSAQEWVKVWEGICGHCDAEGTVKGIGKGPGPDDPKVGDHRNGACCACGNKPMTYRCVFVGWKVREGTRA